MPKWARSASNGWWRRWPNSSHDTPRALKVTLYFPQTDNNRYILPNGIYQSLSAGFQLVGAEAMTARALPRLCALGGGLLMVAPKAAVILVGGAGLFSLYGLIQRRGRQETDLRPLLVISYLGAALVAWAMVTAFWAPDPFRAALQAVKVGALSAAGLLAVLGAATLSTKETGQAGKFFVWAICAAVAMLVVGQAYVLATGDALWGQYSKDPLTTMNNGAVILAVMVWPAVAVLGGRGRRSWGVGLVIGVAAVLIPLHSNAALVALATGAAVFLVATKWSGNVPRLLAGLAALAIFLMPVLVNVMSPTPENRAWLKEVNSSAAHRTLIWDYSVEKIKEHPLAGWGMDAARHLGGEEKVMDSFRLMPLHPHNGALQIWLELGLFGAFLAAALAASVFLAAARRTPIMTAVVCAACTGYLVIGSLSYGVWQTWWVAVAWILAISIRLLDKPQANRLRP